MPAKKVKRHNHHQQKEEEYSSHKMVVDEEHLIRLVAARPILFDKSLKAHRKVGLRQQIWREVGDEIGVTAEQCRRRWRSLRDSYTKHYKKTMKPSQSQCKKWIFYDQMSFMEPYLKQECFNIDRQRLDCFPDNSNSEDGDDLHETNLIKFNVMKHDEVVDETTLGNHNTANDHANSSSALSETIQHEQNEHLNVCIDNAKDMKSIDNETHARTSSNHQFEELQYTSLSTDDDVDSNEKFLLSCLPVLKRLSHQKNSLARLQIQKILYEIEFGDL